MGLTHLFYLNHAWLVKLMTFVDGVVVVVIGDIAISPIAIDVTVLRSVCACLTVSHVRALCLNGRRYRHDFFCIRNPVSLPDRVKIWLTSVNRSTPSSPNFAPMQPTPVDLNAGDIRSQIEAEWLEIAQWSKWRAYTGNHYRFRMVPSLTP